MDDAARVRFVEGVGDLDARLDRFPYRQRSLRDPLRQQLAVDEFHDDEVGAIAFADVVGDGDVRRAQHRGGAGLGEEAGAAFGVRLERRRQELEGDRPSQAQIVGAIHLAHPACPETFLDPVVLDGCSDHVIDDRGQGARMKVPCSHIVKTPFPGSASHRR